MLLSCELWLVDNNRTNVRTLSRHLFNIAITLFGMSKGAFTRSRILDEAMKIASREGLQGLTIGTLAETLALSKSGLFAHFGSKEALQIAVLEHTGDRFLQKVAPPVQRAEPGLPRLKAMLQGWLDWIDDPELPGGCPVLGACFELDDRQGAPREKLVALQKGAQARLALLVKEAMAEGHLDRAAPIPQILFELRAMTLAYHTATRVLGDPDARKRTWTAFDALMERYAAEKPVAARRRARN
jgi:AcrR family transcriptional regulator